MRTFSIFLSPLTHDLVAIDTVRTTSSSTQMDHSSVDRDSSCSSIRTTTKCECIIFHWHRHTQVPLVVWNFDKFRVSLVSMFVCPRSCTTRQEQKTLLTLIALNNVKNVCLFFVATKKERTHHDALPTHPSPSTIDTNTKTDEEKNSINFSRGIHHLPICG